MRVDSITHTVSGQDEVAAEVALHNALLKQAGIRRPTSEPGADAFDAEAQTETLEAEKDVLEAIYGEDATFSSTPHGTFLAVKLGKIKGVRGRSALEVFVPADPAVLRADHAGGAEAGASAPAYPDGTPVVWFVNKGVPPTARLAVTVALTRKAVDLAGEMLVHELVTWLQADGGAARAVMGRPPKLPVLASRAASKTKTTAGGDPSAASESGSGSGSGRSSSDRRRRGGQPQQRQQRQRRGGGGRVMSASQRKQLSRQLKSQWEAKRSNSCVWW